MYINCGMNLQFGTHERLLRTKSCVTYLTIAVMQHCHSSTCTNDLQGLNMLCEYVYAILPECSDSSKGKHWFPQAWYLICHKCNDVHGIML